MHWPQHIYINIPDERLIIQSVRLLVSASPNQPANSVFLSQKTSTSQAKPAPTPTSEQAQCAASEGISFLEQPLSSSVGYIIIQHVC